MATPGHFAPRADWLAGAIGSACFALVSLLPIAALAVAWLGGGLPSLALAVPSARTLGLLANSLGLALAVAILAALIGTGLAIYIHSGSDRWRRLVHHAYLLPLLIPPYIHALAWMAIAGRRQVLEQAIGLAIGPDRFALSAYGFVPTVAVLVFAFAPIVTLLTLVGLEAIEPELVEQACLLRPSWPVACRILLPLVAPSALAGAGLVFVLSLLEYGVPSLLQFNVYVMEVYASFSQDNDPVRAVAVAGALVLASATTLAGVQWGLKTNPLRGQPRRFPPLDTEQWPSLARTAVQWAVAALFLSVIGPVAVLLFRTGAPAAFVAALPPAARDIALTLAVATAAASVATPIAVLTASALVRSKRLGASGWLLCTLPLAVPAPLTGIALIYVGNQPWLDWGHGTPLLLVLAHMARLLPFAVFAAAAQVRRIDPALLEAVSLHNVGWWRRTLRVHAPLLAPAVMLSWLVMFVLSLGELGASLMVAPPGQATLPMRIYNLMHYGATESVAALSLMMLAVAAVTGAIAIGLGRRLWPWTA